jgi:hypothetical protein
VRQLDDDSYAVRLGAAQRLEWLLGNPKLICPLMLRLKRLLADAKPTVGKEGEVESAWRRAHSAWLLSDPADWALPAVTDAEFLQWIDDLASPSPQGETSGAWRVYRTAERELMDALARDEIAPRIAKALETRLASETDAEAKSRLQTVFDMTKPEMVAEYWQGRRHLSEQHLLVGVPATYPGAPNPTHFDRVDDETAHCVSGNSLSPGDYPVGVAIPHPMQASAIFHLVNLPTPRRRQAYLCYAQIDDAKRLTEISRRTLDRFLEKKSLLTAAELLMLGQLDPTEVSRFAGKYFHAVDDAPLQQLLPLAQLPDPRIRRMGPRPSRFGAICGQLAVDGVKEAMPGLTDAIAKKRFLPPTNTAPYRLEWLAAFSIAVRDPWPEVDAWLADQVDHHELLAQGRQLTKSPEIGATAAALLLKRQGQLPASFGLEPAKEDVTIEQLRIEGYRFAGEESRDRVKAWIAKKNER